MRLKSKDEDFYTDSIDNRQCVHNLVASEKDNKSTFFFSMTCNQSETPGVSKIKNWIESDDVRKAMKTCSSRYQYENEDEFMRQLHQAAARGLRTFPIM